MIRGLVWNEIKGTLPNGVARAWNAQVDGKTLCGIFETMVDSKFILAYHRADSPKSTTEKFPSVEMAMMSAQTLMSNVALRGK